MHGEAERSHRHLLLAGVVESHNLCIDMETTCITCMALVSHLVHCACCMLLLHICIISHSLCVNGRHVRVSIHEHGSAACLTPGQSTRAPAEPWAWQPALHLGDAVRQTAALSAAFTIIPHCRWCMHTSLAAPMQVFEYNSAWSRRCCL